MRKWLQKMEAGLLGISMLISSLSGTGLCFAQVAAAQEESTVKTGEIVLDGDDIQSDNVNGLTYKGFGMLCANSTSDLLLDYKAQQPEAYAQMMEYLFGGEYPIMNQVKLEMGNDRNNSTGAEASTKRSREEQANVLRNAGWQIAADAKKINPNVRVSILKWNSPAWVQDNADVYQWYKETILAAYEQYGFMIDYINPNTNEKWSKSKDIENTKQFASWIAAETSETIPDETELQLFQQIKLIVSDDSSTVKDSVAQAMKDDTDFYNAVDVVGYHYSPYDDSNGGMKWLADEEDKEVWNSEAQATFSNSAFRPANNTTDPTVAGTGLGGTGSALEMANTFIKGFVESRRTHVIYQPAVGSFYEGGDYSFKELISARDPWSGWMHYDAGLLVLAHVSKFAVTGWENEDNTAGIWRGVVSASSSGAEGTNPVNGRNGSENYMTLAAPTKDNFSTVIVNDSEYTMNYTLEVKNMNLSENQTLSLWETRAADDGAFNENYMKSLGDITVGEDGKYKITVKPYSIVTVTTLDVSDEIDSATLPVEGERTVLDTDSTGDVQDTESQYLYADDFDYSGKTVAVLNADGSLSSETEDYISSRGGDTGAIARYTNNINGAFEAYKREDGNYVLRQQLDKDAYGTGSAWNGGDAVSLIGDFRWTNYTAAVDVLFEGTDNDPYGAISIRQTGSSQNLTDSSGYTLKVSATGEWQLYRLKKVVDSGTLTEEDGFYTGAGAWNRLRLQGAGDTITAWVNDTKVAVYQDANPITAGRIGLGSAYTFTQFDNLSVKKIKGYVPYYTELLDNLEMYDLSADKNDKLVYNDKWTHANGKGMYVYQRSLSESTGAGATLTYTFQGTGLEILAGTETTADLKVTVDGTVTEEKATTQTAGNMQMIYSLQGLLNGTHTVTLEVLDGTLSVDMVGILGALYDGDTTDVDTTNVVTTTQAPVTQPSASPEVTAAPSGADASVTQTAAPEETVDSDNGKEFTKGNGKYKILDAASKTAAYTGAVKSSSNVVIPATVTSSVTGKNVTYKVVAIADGALKNNKKVKTAIVGSNVATIGKEAFMGCTHLKRITIKSAVLKKAGKNALKGVRSSCVLKVPAKKKTAYKKLFTAVSGFKKTMKIK